VPLTIYRANEALPHSETVTKQAFVWGPPGFSVDNWWVDSISGGVVIINHRIVRLGQSTARRLPAPSEWPPSLVESSSQQLAPAGTPHLVRPRTFCATISDGQRLLALCGAHRVRCASLRRWMARAEGRSQCDAPMFALHVGCRSAAARKVPFMWTNGALGKNEDVRASVVKDRKVLEQLTLTGSVWEQVTRNNIPSQAVPVLQLQRYAHLCKEKSITLELRCQNTIRNCDIAKVAPGASMTCGSYFDEGRSLRQYVWRQFCLSVMA